MGHVRQGTRGRIDRAYRADRQVFGQAGRGKRDGTGMGEGRLEGGPGPGWWMAVGRLDVAEMFGEWRANADVGP